MEKYFIDCPQCGESVDRLNDGDCKDCCGQNQVELDAHNLENQSWEREYQQAQEDAFHQKEI